MVAKNSTDLKDNEQAEDPWTAADPWKKHLSAVPAEEEIKAVSEKASNAMFGVPTFVVDKGVQDTSERTPHVYTTTTAEALFTTPTAARNDTTTLRQEAADIMKEKIRAAIEETIESMTSTIDVSPIPILNSAVSLPTPPPGFELLDTPVIINIAGVAGRRIEITTDGNVQVANDCTTMGIGGLERVSTMEDDSSGTESGRELDKKNVDQRPSSPKAKAHPVDPINTPDGKSTATQETKREREKEIDANEHL